MSTKDVERCFNEPTLQLLPVNCPYPYSLYSKLLQSCPVCIQIKTYLHIIIHIVIYIINFRSHVQFHIIAKHVSNVHCYPLFLEVPFYPEFVVISPPCFVARLLIYEKCGEALSPETLAAQLVSNQFMAVRQVERPDIGDLVLLWRGGWLGGRWQCDFFS